MILHLDREGDDCIRKLRCHCIQIMHSDIYSVGILQNISISASLTKILIDWGGLFHDINLKNNGSSKIQKGMLLENNLTQLRWRLEVVEGILGC